MAHYIVRRIAIATQLSLLLAATAVLTAPKAGYAGKVSHQGTKSASYKPLPAQECQQLRNEAAKALKTSFTISTAAFTDPRSQEKGKACVLKAKGTGKNFQSPFDVMQRLRAALVGWQEDLTFAADGPTGKVIGFTRGRTVLMAAAEWEPAAGVKCSNNQPIAACNLKPEQQIYAIVLKAAAK